MEKAFDQASLLECTEASATRSRDSCARAHDWRVTLDAKERAARFDPGVYDGAAMTKLKATHRSAQSDPTSELGLGLSHLRRETRTALELAVVALAPSELLERLAAAAGLLEALIELPANSPPAMALIPGLVERTRASLDAWQQWQRENLEKKMPRG